MITKSDVVLLLTELQESGEDVSKEISNLYKSDIIPLEILKKINDNRPIEILSFYEKLRSSYNKKHSKMYINIMRSDENTIQDAKTVLTTLSALLNQILQFECENKPLFLKHARAEEIVKVLGIYFDNFNIEPAYRLLKLIKADIKVLSMIKN